MKTVGWLSGGVSSFIAIYLMKDEVDEVIYIDIDDQHPDTLRFVKDCEKVLDKPITILRSKYYRSVEDVVRASGCINTVAGARCSETLKKHVRKEWESTQVGMLRYIFGFDLAETNRANRLSSSGDGNTYVFPLIERKFTKVMCHKLLRKLGIKRPAMYDLGYNNNNCIGCVKGGLWYWNKIRRDFPEVFKSRAKLERDVGYSCNKKWFLDELPPNVGYKSEEINDTCFGECVIIR